MEQKPSRMLAVLRDCGALARILPELDAQWGVPMMLVIDHAAERGYALPVRFAALVHDLGSHLITELSRRLRVPTECRDLAVMTAREHGNVSRALELPPDAIVTLFERCDAFRKPDRFAQMLLACESDMRSRDLPQAPYLLRALDAARGVNAGEVAARYVDNRQKIPEAVRAARVSAVNVALGDVRD
jgi:tRNA nucleotidyltransferase (CCA-adding enzyme)